MSYLFLLLFATFASNSDGLVMYQNLFRPVVQTYEPVVIDKPENDPEQKVENLSVNHLSEIFTIFLKC